ncbi:ion transporter [Porticoccaceae bacterium]|nr:ion transporter [Porticoccaceae bacterium]
MPLTLREKIYHVIFGTDSKAGRRFDLLLIYAILFSVAAVMLDSVAAVNQRFGRELLFAEWLFTAIFTLEYVARIYSSPKPWRYVFSFYGVVDFLSILPTYLSLLFPEATYWMVVRLLRVLRIFRVLKLARYSAEASLLMRSLVQARHKIFVFFGVVLVLSVIFGSVMFLVEGAENGFTSIPRSIYWTIVTITTVGYGDITPQTVIGQFIATLAMLTGYSIIAIPTGILSAEISKEMGKARALVRCNICERGGHHDEAEYCYHCGIELPEWSQRQRDGGS